MIKSFCILLATTWACVAHSQSKMHAAAPRQVQVSVSPNVELLGFVYFLGYEGAQSETASYSDKTRRRYAYGIDLYRRYKSFANSKNLATAVAFAENIWLDYFINLLIQLDDFPNARLRNDIDSMYYRRFSPTGDIAEARKNATEFLEAMNALHREVNFGAYLAASQKLYLRAIDQVKAGLPDGNFLPVMESFYQGSFDQYQLMPSLTIPAGMGFGARYERNGTKRAVHVFGAFAPPQWADTSKIDMGFGDNQHLRELSVHEFGHSFVNPVVDQVPHEVIAATEKLFGPIRHSMEDQGYTSWKACLYEHFTRAGEVLIARNLGHKADAERLLKYYGRDRQFIYLDTLVDELGKYNQSKAGSYSKAVDSGMQRLRELVK